MSDAYLNFQEISQKINFIDVLNWLNIPYTKKKNEFKGETEKFKFIINIEKNLFFSPNSDSIKGSVINFLSQYNDVGLRQAAQELKNTFIDEPKPKKKDIPNLELHYTPMLDEFGIDKDIAESYEIGLVKQKSIMKGRIAFKVYDEEGELQGYVGWHPERKNWLFPKGLKRPLYNAYNVANTIVVTTDLFDCMRLITLGVSATSCLMGKSMTDKQEKVLNKYKRILLLHPEPDNIILRLSRSSYVKAPIMNMSLKEYSDEEILSFLD